MKQKKTFKDKTLWEISRDSNPTVWVCGKVFDDETGEYKEHNGKPVYSGKK